jgi:ubiquitin
MKPEVQAIKCEHGVKPLVDEAVAEPPAPSAADVDAMKTKVSEAGSAVKEAKAGEDKDAVKPALDALMKLKKELGEMEKAARWGAAG